jgi:hypothetical protein
MNAASWLRPVVLGGAVALVLGLASGCNEESTQPEDDSLVLPALTSPENVISAMQVIYNDKTHSKDERLAAYASLFDSAFVFHFQPADVAGGLPPSWGLDDELAGHEAMFAAQAAGDIYSLELRITHDPARSLTPPEVGREGWQEVFATSVYLRLMFNTEDGLEVNGAQGEFKFPPPEGGQFRIEDWIDLPRPFLARVAVDRPSWGQIKSLFNRPRGG